MFGFKFRARGSVPLLRKFLRLNWSQRGITSATARLGWLAGNSRGDVRINPPGPGWFERRGRRRSR